MPGYQIGEPLGTQTSSSPLHQQPHDPAKGIQFRQTFYDRMKLQRNALYLEKDSRDKKIERIMQDTKTKKDEKKKTLASLQQGYAQIEQSTKSLNQALVTWQEGGFLNYRGTPHQVMSGWLNLARAMGLVEPQFIQQTHAQWEALLQSRIHDPERSCDFTSKHIQQAPARYLNTQGCFIGKLPIADAYNAYINPHQATKNPRILGFSQCYTTPSQAQVAEFRILGSLASKIKAQLDYTSELVRKEIIAQQHRQHNPASFAATRAAGESIRRERELDLDDDSAVFDPSEMSSRPGVFR